MVALGVNINLSSTGVGRILVENTPKRIAEICAVVDAVLSKRTLTHKDALVLRGRLAFCDVFVFGRTGTLALQIILQHAYNKPFRQEVSVELQTALKLLRGRISNGPPRCVSLDMYNLVYRNTDAVFSDDNTGGLGGVLVDSTGTVINKLVWYLTGGCVYIILSEARSKGSNRRT